MNPTDDAFDAGPLTTNVLRALADGATDRDVARDLRVSTRTVQRVVDEFKAATGSRTRLAAGVAACRLGLLPHASHHHRSAR